jgi:hypothetical protein
LPYETRLRASLAVRFAIIAMFKSIATFKNTVGNHGID